MTVYYARGGGLGHVTRARRVLDALGLEAEIVTRLPEHADHLIVDAFPGGLEGELCSGVRRRKMDYIARLLRWDEYRKAVPHDLPHFHTTYIVEELTPDHLDFVHAHSDRVVHLELAVEAARDVAVEDYWLVVHSGPEHEVRELVAYAAELNPRGRIVVASPFAVDGYERVDAYPASALFPAAARIVSAAGFNVMLETEPWREKHLVVPFPRKFDDQFTRAARRRARPTRPPRTETSAAAR
jgi:hypothetical protein